MAVESIRSFGRTRSRTIKPNQAALLTEWLPRLSIKPDLSGLSAVAACFEETWLEIGFGGGEHLAAQAAALHVDNTLEDYRREIKRRVFG